MPGTVLNASYILSCKILKTPFNEMGIVFIPILQMRTLTYREGELLAQGHSLVNCSPPFSIPRSFQYPPKR